jgi:hypothetical protein
MKLRDAKNADLAALLGYRCMAAGGLRMQGGVSGPLYQTQNTITYTADGVIKTKAAAASQNLATNKYGANDATNLPAGKTGYWVIALDAAGNIKNFQSVRVLPDGSVQHTEKIPDVAAGYTPVGVIKVVNASAGNFVPGTTNFDAAGITTTFYDVAMLPLAETL